MLEETIALRVEYIIFFGGVGVLKPEIERWKIIVPTKAIRDEGTSYHYQLPSKYSTSSPSLFKAIKKLLKMKILNLRRVLYGPQMLPTEKLQKNAENFWRTRLYVLTWKLQPSSS